MVAARFASLPLLPTGVSEEGVVWAEVGGASACLANRDMGVKSGTESEVSATGNTGLDHAWAHKLYKRLTSSPPPSQHFLC